MSEEKKQLPTKKFLIEQIEHCRKAIEQNQGAINLCLQMIKTECYVEEQEKGE